jgi:predicted kinase
MKTETPMKLAASSEFLSSDTYSLWYIQQRKLSLPSFEQHGVAFPLIVTESDILTAEEKAEARQQAVRRYQDEELRKLQNRTKPTKAKTETQVQPSLFDFGL